MAYMREEELRIAVEARGERILLEARVANPHSGQAVDAPGVVICHPHPLYGGNMDNPVVSTLQQVFADLGLTTLRFNFRGVGESTGHYDEGRGEREDVLGVVSFKKTLGFSRFYGAGYSFGSWVLLKSFAQMEHAPDPGLRFSGLILVSPPVDVMDFQGVRIPRQVPCLILAGSQDTFCTQASLQAWLQNTPSTPSSLALVEGADHFFWNHLDTVGKNIRQEMETWMRIASAMQEQPSRSFHLGNSPAVPGIRSPKPQAGKASGS